MKKFNVKDLAGALGIGSNIITNAINSPITGQVYEKGAINMPKLRQRLLKEFKNDELCQKLGIASIEDFEIVKVDRRVRVSERLEWNHVLVEENMGEKFAIKKNAIVKYLEFMKKDVFDVVVYIFRDNESNKYYIYEESEFKDGSVLIYNY